MNEEIKEYEKYLLSFGVVEKPKMPKFDVLAYNDNEYVFALTETMCWFENVDDEYLTIKHLKGDWWK